MDSAGALNGKETKSHCDLKHATNEVVNISKNCNIDKNPKKKNTLEIINDRKMDNSETCCLCLKCQKSCGNGAIKCDDCKNWVHYLCSEAPIYILLTLQNTNRKYSCFLCAEKHCKDNTYKEQFQYMETELANQYQDTEIQHSSESDYVDNENQLKIHKDADNDCDNKADSKHSKTNNDHYLSNKNKNQNQRSINEVESNWKPICKYHKRQGCKNTDCKYRHPPVCRYFLIDGISKRGCKNPSNCKYSHPNICRSSWKNRECYNSMCQSYHLKGTIRRPERLSNVTYSGDALQQAKQAKLLQTHEKRHTNFSGVLRGPTMRDPMIEDRGRNSEPTYAQMAVRGENSKSFKTDTNQTHLKIDREHFLVNMMHQMQETQNQIRDILLMQKGKQYQYPTYPITLH